MDIEEIKAAAPVAHRPAHKTIVFIALTGVLLPIVSIIFESITGICGAVFFDPLPTHFHTAMFATIPLANLRIILALRRGEASLPPRWAWLHTISVGVGILYSLVFLPIAPLSLIAIAFVGIGFMGLAPMFAVCSALLARKAMKKFGPARAPSVWHGLGLALAVFVVIDMPATITRVGMHMAAYEAADTRLRGIQWLRVVGNEDVMLRLCYQKRGLAAGLIGSVLEYSHPIDPESARAIFYQVTGEPFNNRPAPARRGLRDWERAFDPDVGGEAVGQRASDVTLRASRIDGSVDAHAALGYLEWTMEFHNGSPVPQEGRAKVTLPPGAVVSRATLWINGEEREAAFGGRAQVRQAYQKVVATKRDPLLVTTAGTDQVLVQLFPIPAGGDMKIRIGITAPMTPGPTGPQLLLPSFNERNFELSQTLRHAAWIESKTPLKGGDGMRAEAGPGGLSALRGMLAEPAPGQPRHAIAAPGMTPAALAWTEDKQGADGTIIVQTRSEAPVTAPRRVAVVIDGSAAMRPLKEQLAAALTPFPKNLDTALVFAGDETPTLHPYDHNDSPGMLRHLQGLDFTGGRDNGAALAAAWDWASQVPGSAIVWIHGPQPIASVDQDGLLQRLERRARGVRLYDVTAVDGPNLIAQKLDEVARVARVPRHAGLTQDLRALFAQWQPGATQIVTSREQRTASAPSDAVKTSAHLARLWAADEVAALSADTGKQGQAVALAVQYQLVTPVSGAVVLETREQYQDAGLEPVPPGSVPTIPEPETWMLLIVCMLALTFGRRYFAK